jgi:hypothetical protein
MRGKRAPLLDCFGAVRLAMTVAYMYIRPYLIEGKTRLLSRSAYFKDNDSSHWRTFSPDWSGLNVWWGNGVN